jgi:bisphosphoglycerate-independent phosphoglycerate mutase (AlkP superfamily)
MPRNKPLILTILDGWGFSPAIEGNAIAAARKPSRTSDCPKARWVTAKWDI